MDSTLLPSHKLHEKTGSDILQLPRTLNVTRQLQLLAEEHQTPRGLQVRLDLPPKQKYNLEGFVDPCPGRPKCLLLRYWFSGRPHQAVVEDSHAVHLPRRQHAAACPHLKQDHQYASSLEASLLQCAALGPSPPHVKRRRARGSRHSMAPGDFPDSLLQEQNLAPAMSSVSAAQGPPACIVLDSSRVQQSSAAYTPAAAVSGATPRKHRRPSTVSRRPSVLSTVELGTIDSGPVGCQVQARESGSSASYMLVAGLATAVLVGSVATAVALVGPEKRDEWRQWLRGALKV